MSVPDTIALILFLFPLAFSPGPGNLFFAANGARFGVVATLPANLGYHLATWVVTLGVGLGFLETAEALPGLMVWIRIIGAAYVLYLAWSLFRAGAPGAATEARPAGLRDGALLLLLNPKGYLIMGLMFSQFLSEDARGPGTILWITTVFTLNNAVAFLSWTLLGDRAGTVLRHRAGARYLNRALGVMLATLALWLVWPG